MKACFSSSIILSVTLPKERTNSALVFAISRPFSNSRETGILRDVPGNPGNFPGIFFDHKTSKSVPKSIQIWLFYIALTLRCLTLQLLLEIFAFPAAFIENST